jgi:hypothetical protein
MAIPIINSWKNYYQIANEGLGSSYERIILNKLLLKLYDEYHFASALESPCFGFTGTSGINLVALAQKGCRIMLEDDDLERIDLIKETWNKLGLQIDIRYNKGFKLLDYPDDSIDLCFNFSAMWFVNDLSGFIKEICRISAKCILICVPNTEGIGFKGQLKGYTPERYPNLHPSFIDRASIIFLMQKYGWNLLEENYIDCPPWPDIGMNKEDFFQQRFGITCKKHFSEADSLPEAPLSILPYYRGEDPDFARRMLRLSFLERYAPQVFKRFWAHHRYLLFCQ